MTNSEARKRAQEAASRTVHEARSPRWRGHPRQYQPEALRLFRLDHRGPILPWSYITTECETQLCLDTTCMVLNTPKALGYPAGQCVYCGMPAGQRDHLLPEPLTGLALRHVVLTVPACGDCNARINDFPSANIAERRQRAHDSIQRGAQKLIARGIKKPAEMVELGPALRSVAVKNNLRLEAVRLRLSWPDDPFYDLRAFQIAGIDDPVALGMCKAVA